MSSGSFKEFRVGAGLAARGTAVLCIWSSQRSLQYMKKMESMDKHYRALRAGGS